MFIFFIYRKYNDNEKNIKKDFFFWIKKKVLLLRPDFNNKLNYCIYVKPV